MNAVENKNTKGTQPAPQEAERTLKPGEIANPKYLENTEVPENLDRRNKDNKDAQKRETFVQREGDYR